MADLIELDMFPNEPVLEWKNSSAVPKGRLISYLKARNDGIWFLSLRNSGKLWRPNFRYGFCNKVGVTNLLLFRDGISDEKALLEL
ncbi:hypothetical protein H5410_022983 [Solanum commersonii]|uniref:Uncharacterized protein n=1 Tax=Solanum commersonii TaxID=4109 RepID=A0A9J5ZJV4_SOLCO|nr:hypothetical protein H5410_022983 [Solanum commersonii]